MGGSAPPLIALAAVLPTPPLPPTHCVLIIGENEDDVGAARGGVGGTARLRRRSPLLGVAAQINALLGEACQRWQGQQQSRQGGQAEALHGGELAGREWGQGPAPHS